MLAVCSSKDEIKTKQNKTKQEQLRLAHSARFQEKNVFVYMLY